MDNERIQSNNKRIAKNTLIVYIRLCTVMVVGLFTSRFVLQSLGVSDYGLYNVVGSVLAILSFLSGSLTTTTTRFINIEEGKKRGNTNLIFNACLILHIAVAIILFILAETIGIYYINHYLRVPLDMKGPAMFVFQISIIVACVGLINIPYQGLLVAKEKFSVIACVDIFNCIIKFSLVLLLFLFSKDRIQIYAIFMSFSTVISFVAFHWYCHKKWRQIIKKNQRIHFGHVKEIIKFNNYNLLGSLSLTIRDQGSNVLINFFFGTGVNAAYAIARTIQGYVNNFTANFDIAAAPQITKKFGSGEKNQSERLTGLVGRICMLMMLLIFFPLIIELDFILRIWLVEVPNGAVTFSYLTLILVYVGATSAGLAHYINASGKIKWFKIQHSILYISCLPIAYFLFKKNFEAYTVVLLFVLADVLSRINQFILLKRIVGFDSLEYIKEAYIRPFIISVLSVIISILLLNIMPNNSLAKTLNIVIIFFIVLVLDILIGLKKNERKVIINRIESKFNKR